MRKIQHHQLSFTVYDTPAELPETYQALFKAAQQACQKAYAPYSNFWVGAALQIEGDIIVGNNQENAAYPSGMCAERTLIYWAGANHPNATIEAIAIAAKHPDEPYDLPVTPCGACRQALSEYEIRQQQSIPLIFRGSDQKIWIAPSIAVLLPLAFSASNL